MSKNRDREAAAEDRQATMGLSAEEYAILIGDRATVEELKAKASRIERRHLDTVDRRYERLVPEWDDRGYVHSVLAQCFLPYRLTDDHEPYKRIQYRPDGTMFCGLIIEAGTVISPDGETVRPGIPFGTKARLLLSWITTQALRTQTPELVVPSSMSALMKELGLRVSGGETGTIRAFKEQLTRLSAARMTVVTSRQDGQTVRHSKTDPIREFDVWFPSDPDQGTLWPSTIVLGTEFFDSLCTHAVPFDRLAMAALSHNARAMDLYLWLSQRLHRIRPGRGVIVPWRDLMAMFGGADTHMPSFKREFRKALGQVAVHYSAAAVEEVSAGLELRHSPPAIPAR